MILFASIAAFQDSRKSKSYFSQLSRRRKNGLPSAHPAKEKYSYYLVVIHGEVKAFSLGGFGTFENRSGEYGNPIRVDF
jgi:hypothetical protein